MHDDSDSDHPGRVQQQQVYDNLTLVEDALQRVVEEHRHGTYGFLTREWGFTAPGGLGPALEHPKFAPWHATLDRCRTFFWPVHAYASMETSTSTSDCSTSSTTNTDHRVVHMYRLKQPQGEQLYRNLPLHEFLREPPVPAVGLEDADIHDYRQAAQVFLLLGTLSHLYGNAAPDPSTAVLPKWIEEPLLRVAHRLQIEPTLSAHFLQQENWIWKSSATSTTNNNNNTADMADAMDTRPNDSTSDTTNHNNNHMEDDDGDPDSTTTSPLYSQPSHRTLAQQQHRDKKLLKTLLQNVNIADRRYRVKIYPQCFVAEQAVDIWVDHELVHSREDAVRTARRLNHQYHVFQHVADQHLFMDKYLFFRFLPKWHHVILHKDGPKMDQVLDDLLLLGDDSDETQRAATAVSSNPTASRLLRPKDLLFRKSKTTHSPTSSGIGASLLLRKGTKEKNQPTNNTNNKNNTVDRRLGSSTDTNHHSPTSSGIGASSLLLRKGTKEKNKPTNTVAFDIMGDTNTGGGGGKRRMRDEIFNNTVSHNNNNDSINTNSDEPNSRLSLTTTQLALHDRRPPDDSAAGTTTTTSMNEAINTICVMGMIKVKDRKYHFRTYQQCWIGLQMIDLLVGQECAPTRKDALQLALDINQKFELFDHVCGHHPLKDEYLFYRFRPNFKTMMMAQQTTGGSVVENDEEDDAVSVRTQDTVNSVRRRTQLMLDENLTSKRSFGGGGSGRVYDKNGTGNNKDLQGSREHDNDLYDDSFLLDDDDKNEFRIDNIDMLYPAFGHVHEKMNQLIPACMGYALAGLPFLILDILSTMRNILEAESNVNDTSSVDSYESRRLYDLLYKVAFSLSRCKEAFQLMSTDPHKRTFNSKHISIRQTQPLSNGVLVQGKRRKGTTGTQFPYFHLLDWLLGRHQFKNDNADGLVAQIAAIDETYPRPQREFIDALSKIDKASTLRGFLDLLGRPRDLMSAYNHMIECYAGEGGVLQAHCRKLYSYIHNDVQFSTSGTTHLKASGANGEGCPMSKAANNHLFATTMFQHMQHATNDRWVLRMPPLMNQVRKIVYSTSESGGFTTVALDLLDSGLQYEYGDVVKVLLPNDDKRAFSWIASLKVNNQHLFTLEDMQSHHKDQGNGWGWAEVWEALGWSSLEEQHGGVSLELICRYIELAQIRDKSGKTRWVNSPLDTSVTKTQTLFPVPPPLSFDSIASLEPVSPRVYSVSGVEVDRVFLLVSKPQDGARHHGYDGMCDPLVDKVHCSFTPATFFLVPPTEVNLVCIASGTGISPFVGLADAIGSRRGNYTIAHQCKSSDLFLANSQTWLDFTAANPGAVVFGYISGDKSRRNCPMRYIVRNGCFEETTVLRRHNSSAYYFECVEFQGRIQEAYQEGGLNLAYCCGGVKSAIEPLREMAKKKGMIFEFTCECYGVPATLTKNEAACQIGGTVLSLDHVSPIHPGGDQILHQIHQVAHETQTAKTPDHSVAFWQLHPHAYNLWRCLRTPMDADSEAFTAFLERQAARKSVMVNMASKYAEVALASPDDSKILRIATELQANAVRRQMAMGNTKDAKEAAAYLEALLRHVSPQDQDADRWHASLTGYHDSIQPAENGGSDVPLALLPEGEDAMEPAERAKTIVEC